MNKIAKAISSTLMAGIMALSLAVSASAARTHYSQKLTCGAYVRQSPSNHIFYTTVNGVPVARNCTQTINVRKHTRTCTVNGGCGYSITDGGSGCFITHSKCGTRTTSLH